MIRHKKGPLLITALLMLALAPEGRAEGIADLGIHGVVPLDTVPDVAPGLQALGENALGIAEGGQAALGEAAQPDTVLVKCRVAYGDGTPKMGSTEERTETGHAILSFVPTTLCGATTWSGGHDDGPVLDSTIDAQAWYCVTYCNPPVDGTPCVSTEVYDHPGPGCVRFARSEDQMLMRADAFDGQDEKNGKLACNAAAGAASGGSPSAGMAVKTVCVGIDVLVWDDHTKYAYEHAIHLDNIGCGPRECAEKGVIWLTSTHTIVLESYSGSPYVLVGDEEECASDDPCDRCTATVKNGKNHLVCVAFRGLYVDRYYPPPPEPTPGSGSPPPKPVGQRLEEAGVCGQHGQPVCPEDSNLEILTGAVVVG